MNVIPVEPHKSLNKAFLKQKPLRSEIELFKANLIRLLDKVDEIEREENQKNHIRDFLRDTFYKDTNEINTKDTKDLVIHLGKTNKDKVGVIIEAKRPGNKTEMLSLAKPNSKALQELVLYYLRERIEDNNIDIKYLIATNVYEWYIFEAATFEKLFYRNKAFVKQYEQWRDGQKVTRDTNLLYNDIARPFIDTLTDEIACTHFDIRKYETILRNENKKDDKSLIALQKLLSPNHLLKVPFTNDSNSLNEKFYKELLHIIGLEEVKEGSKNIIRRKVTNRQSGSLLENTINILETDDSLRRIKDKSSYGETREDQLFTIALELCLTWINRILFLKLLEGQLITYHNGDPEYRFLNTATIVDFDELYKLFHQVLARNANERTLLIQQKYNRVPYLNSSLFEISELEDLTVRINSLDDSETLELTGTTILKEERKKTSVLPTLQYLFKFLDAYDFASEGGEDIAEDNKTIINASVLGKVFEKINGYKDGSIFTPGFITMYMSRQSLRPAVIQKFNEHFKTTGIAEATTFEELYNRVDKVEIKTANEIVNSLRVCDPAVGSGHFLVSALNELILIKSELGILADKNGKRLRDYEFTIENDELIITEEHGLFVYNHLNKESQRVQETIFGERQTIIENCLFGVDINPNSVKICRLRLWIELLKSSYYKVPGYVELETLPNIDINIKCGNSLISRYALDADIKKALKRSKWSIESYRIAVMSYRNASSKDEKRAMEELINTIKTDFETEVQTSDKRYQKLSRAKGELFNLTNQGQLFEKSKKEKAEWNKKVSELTHTITKLETEIEEIKNNAIYKNAFEWRFEFPEVLNDEGDFVGFDVVIGNPPYVFARDNFSSNMKSYFIENYQTTQYQVNLYFLFIEKTISLMRKSGGFSLIVPNSLLMVSSAKHLRKHLLNEVAVSEIINLMGKTFEGINVEAIIISGIRATKNYSSKISIYVNEGADFILTQSKEQGLFMQNDGSELTVFSNDHNDSLISKLRNGSEDLNDLVLIKAGLQAYESGKGNPKQTAEDVKNRPYDYSYKFDENTYEYLEGKDVQRYQIKWSGTFLQYGNNLAAPRTFDIFSGNKIIIREITGKHPFSIIAAFSDEIFLFNRSNIAIVEKEKPLVQLKYILAILNSKLLSHYFITKTAKSVRQLFPKLILEDLRKFPIKVILSADQQPFIQLVDQILEAKKQGQDTLALERQVDELVYELYGITEEERRVIEGR